MFTRQAEQNRRKWEHLVPSVHCVPIIPLRLKHIQLNDSKRREDELVNESPFNRQRSCKFEIKHVETLWSLRLKKQERMKR